MTFVPVSSSASPAVIVHHSYLLGSKVSWTFGELASYLCVNFIVPPRQANTIRESTTARWEGGRTGGIDGTEKEYICQNGRTTGDARATSGPNRQTLAFCHVLFACFESSSSLRDFRPYSYVTLVCLLSIAAACVLNRRRFSTHLRCVHVRSPLSKEVYSAVMGSTILINISADIQVS